MVEMKIQERQGPHGSVENVPSRTGVSSSIPVQTFTRANQDNFTDIRRQKYGETSRYSQPVGANQFLESLSNPNDTKTPNNPTRNDQINGTFQRSSTQ